ADRRAARLLGQRLRSLGRGRARRRDPERQLQLRRALNHAEERRPELTTACDTTGAPVVRQLHPVVAVLNLEQLIPGPLVVEAVVAILLVAPDLGRAVSEWATVGGVVTA